jgi:hypothetical protein
MWQFRSSGSAEGVMGNHDPYSDNTQRAQYFAVLNSLAADDVKVQPSSPNCCGLYRRL